MAKFTQNDVWEDALRLTRTHWPAFVAIAGVFIFLPTLLLNHFIVRPDTSELEDAAAIAAFGAFLRENLIWYVLQSFIVMIGSAAMLRLVFARGVTIGGALWFAILLLPVYSLMLFLANFAVVIGLVLLLVPGLYLQGRLFVAGAAMVAEDRRHPIETIRRAWTLTEGHGWLILGLYLMVWLAGTIVVLAAQQLSGILFILVAGQALGQLLSGIVVAVLTALVTTLLTMISAAVYRALAPQRP